MPQISIAKVIDRAVEHGCDLINMSLGGGDPDEVTRDAIANARTQGTLVIVAVSNDGRQSVSFPASDSLPSHLGLGRKGPYLSGTTQSGDAVAPYGKDEALRLYADGMNLRHIARMVGVMHPTVSKWVNALATQLLDTPPQPSVSAVNEFDELFTFVGSKKRSIRRNAG